MLAEQGLRRGDVLLLMMGNRLELVQLTVAALRLGVAVLPCSEQLRPDDLAQRLRRARPALVVCDERHAGTVAAAAPDCPVLTLPLPAPRGDVPPAADLGPTDPAFVLFTSGTSGPPKLVTHGQRYVWGQRLQARHWLAPRRGALLWSTAAPGWSKSARNAFLAPWLAGAVALLHDGRFDPDERLAIVRREGVEVLCMAPTEYRLIAAHQALGPLPSVRRLVTAGEPLGVAAAETWHAATGLTISDGYGQTETGHLTATAPGVVAPPGSMGRPLPGVRAWIDDGELVVDPDTVPTFFLGYDGEPAPNGPWRTGDLVEQDEDGWLLFRARADDVVLSAGYRIGPAEVEAVLAAHPAVREVAVIGVPDELRGELVCAVVVPASGVALSEALAAELQTHVRQRTAPYKYPRVVRFVDALPRTTTGKINRAELRQRRDPAAGR